MDDSLGGLKKDHEESNLLIIRIENEQRMNISIPSIAVISLTATMSGVYNSPELAERPMTEVCAMATIGYELVGVEPHSDTDLNLLPAPFHTQPVANYRMNVRNTLPDACKT